MISIKDAENIHAVLIERFGGAKGTRDTGSLESAMSRPFQTFDQTELYASPIDKAAARFESIISNHPFIDGNKRTAYVLMRLLLLEDKLDIQSSLNEKHNFVIATATGTFRFMEIREWIVKNVNSLS
jgi:death-on-curing protein